MTERTTLRSETYVLVFLFSHDAQRVVLIHKNRGPANVKGRLNGLGGHVNTSLGESARFAATRESFEESGVCVAATRWRHFERMEGPGWACDCFAAFLSEDMEGDVQTMEDEPVAWYRVTDIIRDALRPNRRRWFWQSRRPPSASNVPWLLMRALDKELHTVSMQKTSYEQAPDVSLFTLFDEDVL